MIGDIELQVLHITEAELVRDIRTILQRVQTGRKSSLNATPIRLRCCVQLTLSAALYPSALR